MEWWEAVLLGILQGVTEWLPISSSGHLVLANEFLGVEPHVGYLLLLHVGTLLAVVWAYRARLASMAVALVSLPRDAKRIGWKPALAHPERMLAIWVVVGTLPIVVVGLAFRAYIEASHEGIGRLWLDFFISGLLLVRASTRTRVDRPMASMKAHDAVVVGLFQAISLLPGVSRSGATLAGAVEQRFRWADAADYAFLLSIPALAGAMVLEWRSFAALSVVGWQQSVLGFVTSLVVGYASIRFLLAFLRRQKPWVFAAYCFAIGGAILALSITGRFG